MYEVFEHTADVGLRVRADALEDLFAEAGRALFSLIVENLEEVSAAHECRFSLHGSDMLYLLFDWLNELLYTFDTRGLLLARFDVSISGDSLEGRAWGEPCDAARHRLDHEIKAITYHGFRLERTGAGWEAEVIVDV